MKKWLAGVLLIMLMLAAAVPGYAEDEVKNTYGSIKLSKVVHTISPLNVTSSLSVTNRKDGYEDIVWSVKNESIATIDSKSGVITPIVKNGSTTITATGSISGKKGTATLVIRTIGIKTMKLNANNVTIAPGRTYRFNAIIQPTNATFRQVTWSLESQNPPPEPANRSHIDPESGLFTAGKEEGEVLSVVATNGTGRRAIAKVTVKTVAVSKVTFKNSRAQVTLNKTLDLSKQVVVSPTNAANPLIEWSTNRETVATVDEKGVVKGIGVGTAQIRATSVDNPAKSAVCTVRVDGVRVTSLTISASANEALDKSDKLKVKATVKPSNASFQEVEWSSSNEDIATVDGSGTVTALKAGKTVITASADLGRISKKFTLRVRGGSMNTVLLSAIGDVTLGGDTKRVKKADDPIGDGRTSYERFKRLYDANGGGYFFKKVESIFESDDITVANFEGVLTDTTSGRANKTVVLGGPTKYKNIAKNAGIDVCGLNNNHMLDFGTAGYISTVNSLSSVGIPTFAISYSKATAKTVNGVKIGFAGFRTPANMNDVKNTIKNLKVSKGCDLVVVSFHWTNSKEWTDNVYPEERAAARYAINSGADLVIGAHKHMVSGIENYKNKMIVYDLGNFISMVRHKTESGSYVTKDTMIFQQRFNVFSDGYVERIVPNIIPAMNSATTDTFTGQPHVATGTAATRILNKIKAKTPTSSKSLVKHISGY